MSDTPSYEELKRPMSGRSPRWFNQILGMKPGEVREINFTGSLRNVRSAVARAATRAGSDHVTRVRDGRMFVVRLKPEDVSHD